MFARARRTKTEEYLENEFNENDSLFADLEDKSTEEDVFSKIKVRKRARSKGKGTQSN